MKREIFKEIALQAGGSHYPEVGGELLQKYSDLLLAEVINTIKTTPIHCAFTTHDLGVVECTISKTIEHVKNHFDVK
jgi:exosome complex RNA-binding protein Csl4